LVFANFDIYLFTFRKKTSNLIIEICQKLLTPHIPLFKVTQGHWNQRGSVSYVGLPISVL